MANEFTVLKINEKGNHARIEYTKGIIKVKGWISVDPESKVEEGSIHPIPEGHTFSPRQGLNKSGQPVTCLDLVAVR